MPGSLILGNDTYSDLSETSGRSYDSKTGPKKVSFNNAVRVKQYPWKPDIETSGEHLTLPNNRFWFKVYKNKSDRHDDPVTYDSPEEPIRKNAWGEDTIESIHDSLAPIAEVEDQDLDSNYSGRNSYSNNHHDFHSRNLQTSGYYSGNDYNNSYVRPVEPPVDYFDDMHLDSSRKGNSLWRNSDSNGDHFNYGNNFTSNSNFRNRSSYDIRYGIPEEPEVHHGVANSISSPVKLPRMNFEKNSPQRRSARTMNDSDPLKKRERRSRSHDDHLDNDSRFKHLKKADKSVSTEDINGTQNNGLITNRFLKTSRDMGTQCYGTLTRGNPSDFGKLSSPSYVLRSETERLNNFKPQRSSHITSNETILRSPVKSVPNVKDIQNTGLVNRTRPYQDYQTNKSSTSNERDTDFRKYGNHLNGKLNNGIASKFNRNEAILTDTMQNDKKTYRSLTNSFSYNDAKNNGDKQSKATRDSSTVGYLRGRQIPLSEVNTNTNRKFLPRNETGGSRNSFSYRNGENNRVPTSPTSLSKLDTQISNGVRSRKYLSTNSENNQGKTVKSDYRSKFHSPSRSDIDNSMIDWSLSGFQLATKPDNFVTSVSDSEYTVHKREPLLMYIPGVSHHDHPAIEDDRLSALSDMSRSEMNDGLSSLASSSMLDKSSPSDIRRRYSMPRDGKMKWIKWKNKK